MGFHPWSTNPSSMCSSRATRASVRELHASGVTRAPQLRGDLRPRSSLDSKVDQAALLLAQPISNRGEKLGGLGLGRRPRVRFGTEPRT